MRKRNDKGMVKKWRIKYVTLHNKILSWYKLDEVSKKSGKGKETFKNNGVVYYNVSDDDFPIFDEERPSKQLNFDLLAIRI